MCIRDSEDRDDDIVDGDVGHVAGWGPDCTSCALTITEVEYVTHSSCLNQVSESLLVAIGPEKFCGQLVGGEERV